MAAWVAVTLLAVAIAPSLHAALGLWRAFVLEPVLWLLVACALQVDREALWKQLSWVVWVLAGVAAFQFVSGWFIPSPWNVGILEGRRATGIFPFPNALALFVAPVGALAIARFLEKRTWMDGVTVLASVLAVALAKSEGAGVALAAVAVVAGFASPKFRKWTALAVGLGCAALLLVAPLRTKVVQEVTFKGWSGKVRLVIWEETVTMLKDRPFFGAGFGAYPTVIKPYHKATYLEIFQFPHNALLNIWSETGVLGLLVVLWLAVTWIKAGKDARMVALAPLLAIAVHGLVDVPYFKNDLAVLFWMLVWLTNSLPRGAVAAREHAGHS
jgi:O-antigen ligase